MPFYFKPKKWERDLVIYRFLGVPLFKKYLISKGRPGPDSRTFHHHNKSLLASELYLIELRTRTYEWRHLLGLAGFILILLIVEKKMTIFDWMFLIVLNLLVNIYPILLQRFNRIRLLELLYKQGFANPYKIK